MFRKLIARKPATVAAAPVSSAPSLTEWRAERERAARPAFVPAAAPAPRYMVSGYQGGEFVGGLVYSRNRVGVAIVTRGW